MRDHQRRIILKEGRALFEQPAMADLLGLEHLERKRQVQIERLQELDDADADSVAGRLLNCSKRRSCGSSACPVCRAIVRQWLNREALRVSQGVSATRLLMNFGDLFCPLSSPDEIDIERIKADAERALTQVGVADRPWAGIVDIRATVIYPKIHLSYWNHDIIMFGANVSAREVDPPLRFPLLERGGACLPCDVSRIGESEHVIPEFEQVSFINSENSVPDSRVIDALATELARMLGHRHVLQDVILLNFNVVGSELTPG